MVDIKSLEERIAELEIRIKAINLIRERFETASTHGCTGGCTGDCPDPTGNCTYGCTHGCTNGCTDGCADDLLPQGIEDAAPKENQNKKSGRKSR